MKLLGIDVQELASRNAKATAEEIVQQPRVWREVVDQIAEERDLIND